MPENLQTKYEMRVTEVGPLVDEFIQSGVLVFFGSNAPEELREFSILHDGHSLSAEVAPGDTIFLGEEPFRVLAVGEVANSNLANLGHLVLKSNGLTEPEMPGDVCVEAKALPMVGPGMRIRIAGAMN